MPEAASERRDDRIFFALADATRRRILELLASGDRSVHAIAAVFPVSRPAISKHLKVLRDAGLVGERTVGRTRVHFRTTTPAAATLTTWARNLATPGERRAAPVGRAAPPRPGPVSTPPEQADDRPLTPPEPADHAEREPRRSPFEPWLGR